MSVLFYHNWDKKKSTIDKKLKHKRVLSYGFEYYIMKTEDIHLKKREEKEETCKTTWKKIREKC